jgi:4-amino-4-deoxy-L-arabinose transferase-like glycosyltransferase
LRRSPDSPSEHSPLDFTERHNNSAPLIAWLALAAAIVCGIALRLAHFDDVFSRTPDERVYTFRAMQIAENGTRVMPPWFAAYAGNSLLWETPPVTRVGHVFVFAAAMRLFGLHDFSAGTEVSLFCSCLTLFLLAWMGVRFFNVWIAAAAVAFLAFSVGELGISRRAWVDSYFALISLLLLYLACEIVRNPRRKFLYPIFLVLGAGAILSKETSILSYGLCGLWVFGWLLWKERSVKMAILLALGGLASAAAALAVWTKLAGSLAIPLQALFHTKVDSQWGRQNTGGPWHIMAYLLWLVGPLTVLLAVIGILFTSIPAGWQAKLRVARLGLGESSLPAARVAALTVVALFCFSSFVGNLKYLRTFSPCDGAYSLMAAVGLWCLLCLARSFFNDVDFRAVVLLALLAIVAEGVRDYRTYTQIVVRTGMEDMTGLWIRKAMRR